MPFTTIYGDAQGSRVVGDTNSLPQVLNPNTIAFADRLRINGYTMSRTELDALNNLVVGLVVNGIWDKCNAIYPFIGGTAATNKFNLKDPRDVNAAFRLNFVGGWTHTANGSQGNGTTGYADTFLTPSTTLTLNDTHLSIYSRTSTVTNFQRDIAAFFSGTNPCMSIGTSTGAIIADQYDFNQRLSVSISSAQGFFHANRSTSTMHKMYINGKNSGNTTTTNTQTLTTINLYLAAANQTPSLPPTAFSNKQYAFASIGASLTDAQAHNYYVLVQRFQTALGRQV